VRIPTGSKMGHNSIFVIPPLLLHFIVSIQHNLGTKPLSPCLNKVAIKLQEKDVMQLQQKMKQNFKSD